MRDFDTPTAVADACPICQSHIEDGDLFCTRCGTFLRNDGSNHEALNLPVVHLLAQVCALQRELLHQFRQGHAIQARQFQRSLQAQAEHLDKTLAHVASQTETAEERIRLWQRWITGLAAAVVVLVIAVVQLAS